jgi:DNA-binding transcriptional ArsR family regulator
VDRLSSAFAALSDPTRRVILNRLTRGPATVNELAKPFTITQQAISKHLAYLERARFIQKRREGREHYCSLKTDAIREVATWAMSYRRFWEQSHARLDLLLEKMKIADPAQKTGRIRGRIKS